MHDYSRKELIRRAGSNESERLKICGSLSSEIVISVIGKCHVLSLFDFVGHLLNLVLRNFNLGRGEERSLDEGEVTVVYHSTEEPDERLLELIVALGRDIVILKVLLSVEGDLLSLDLTITNIDFVTDEDDGDGLTDTGQVLIPLWNVGVGDTGAHIEHDDTAVTSNIIAVTESSELLLTGSIPNVENYLTMRGIERHGMNFDTEGGNIALLEFSSQMTLDEGSLTDTTVTDEYELEFRNLLLLAFCLDHSKTK